MILLYGASGYTGRLTAEVLREESLEPVLAGRRAEAVAAVAEPLGLDWRAGSLQDIDLRGVTALLNCAGPFSRTASALITRCLASGVHYLDLAGEVPEHELALRADGDARDARVLLLPGAGYGIVPSDCLAAMVSRAVGGAAEVQIALKTVGGVSRASAEVVLGSLRTPGVRRTAGELVQARAGARHLRVDFADGAGPTTVVTNPWRADILASVPEAGGLEAYMAFPAPVRALMRIPHGGLLRALARRLPEGPSREALAEGRSHVWARAVGTDGASAEATVAGPDAYIFTAYAAAECLRRVEAGEATPGFHTPASAWGPELLEGVKGARVAAPAAPPAP